MNVISSSNTANMAMAPLKRDAHHYTYADYLRWSGSSGEELIDGTAYVREPPAPSPSHQGIVVGLCHQVKTALKDKPCRVYVAPFDVRIVVSAGYNSICSRKVERSIMPQASSPSQL
jgi:hypothetical protein